MDTRETTQARPAHERVRGWKPVAAVAAAFIVGIVVVGGAILLMGGEGDVRGEATLGPDRTVLVTRDDGSTSTLGADVILMGGEGEPVFDFATDSLCTWFTPDDMNEILAAAQQRAGTDHDFSPFTSGDCEAESGWGVPGRLSVWFMLEPVESFFARVAGDPDAQVNNLTGGELVLDVNPAEFVGHGFLDDEVSYQMNNGDGGFGYESFDWYLRVDGHQDETLYFKFAIDGLPRSIGLDTMTNLGLAMVNEVLERMNWTSSTQ